MSDIPLGQSRPPRWFLVASLGGVAWDVFGAAQFAKSVTSTAQDLMATGLTPEQAATMIGYPLWMTLAFGVGVFGGLVGSLCLLWRKAVAMPILALSLAAYVALGVGDALHGVFAAMGPGQMLILSTVVAIAAALFAISRHPAAKH